jgi:hypothetical protein
MEALRLWIKMNRELTGGAVIACLGLLFIVGSLRRWSWLTEMSGDEYHRMGFVSAMLYEKYGSGYLRIRNIGIGVLLLFVGSVLVLFHL